MLDTVLNTPAPVAGAVPSAASVPLPAPVLYCPFPATACHRDAAALVMRTLGWTKAFALFPDEPGNGAKVRSYSMLAARCYPTASFDRLTIISDYYSWLFAFDDLCEGLSLAGASPEEVHAFLCQIYAVIGVASTWGRSTNRVAGPFIAALGDIWSRIEPATTAGWRSRFIRHVTNYIEGCVWEACNRNIERIPSRAVFQCMRSHTSTMYEFWDFLEFAGGFSLPDAVVEHPMVMELARAANMVASLANDIFSLRKESSNRDIHNIVIVLQHEEGLSRAEACRRAVDLHDAQARHYCALEELLPSFGGQIDRDLSRYCEGMRTWMRANYDWSAVTPRYNVTA
jgi:Terpene synthase family 2, C-terminal metal binding